MNRKSHIVRQKISLKPFIPLIIVIKDKRIWLTVLTNNIKLHWNYSNTNNRKLPTH